MPNNNTGEPDYLTIEEWAEYWRVSTETAAKWARAGRIVGALKIGEGKGLWRIPNPRLNRPREGQGA